MTITFRNYEYTKKSIYKDKDTGEALKFYYNCSKSTKKSFCGVKLTKDLRTNSNQFFNYLAYILNDCAHSCLEYNEEILDNEVDISNLMYELAEENLLFKMGTSAKKVYEEIIEKIFNNKEFENKILVNRNWF